MVTRKIAIEKIKGFVADLQKVGYHPTAIYLFGSVAKGLQHKDSDIDVAIWDDKFTGCIPVDIEPIIPIKLKYKRLEVHTYHSSETVDSDPFIGEILAHGIRIELA